MQKIMIIRHAEKHQHGSHDRGVTEDGRPAHHELTVRGWQRAARPGASVRTARGAAGWLQDSDAPLDFRVEATKHSPSLRAMHTVGPLAAALGIPVNHDFAEDEEAALAAAWSRPPRRR